jgi:ABC-type Fe3+/spermidine/putrescine transport system ATPase subunit
MTATTSIFHVEGVTKRYGALTALHDIDLAVETNEYVSLLGPSGSGKTVLLRTIAGFEAPDAGRIMLNGRDVIRLPAHERGIGFVFQNFALFPHLSVFHNIAFGLANATNPPSTEVIARRVRDSIKLVGLAGLEDRGIGQISGGQKQRVALARTLITEPKLVLLDEPLGALDANLRGRMRNELRHIREMLDVTFLHVTGSETEALAMGDRVIVLDRGAIAQFDKPDTVYNAPATPNVAKFLNRYNMFDGKLRGRAFASSYGAFAFGKKITSAEPAYAVRFDRITPGPTQENSKLPGIAAKFVANEYLGSSIMYFFETPGGQVVEVEHHLSNGAPQNFEPNGHYMLRWKPEDAIVFG